MTRRNLLLLIVVALAAYLCYQRADGEHRARHGRMLHTLGVVIQKIEDRYIEPVDGRVLLETALHAMVAHLGDPHSAYIPPDEAAALREELDKEFGGLGIIVTIDPDDSRLTILSPLYGTPAYEAGLRAGDKILRVDGTDTTGWKLEHAVRSLKGTPGTAVTLTVRSEGEELSRDITLQRAIIHVPTVVGDGYRSDGRWSFLLDADPTLGYIRITHFSKDTAAELQAALHEVVQQGGQGAILDLRDNPGGLLQVAVQVCDLFLDQGTIVVTRYRHPDDVEVYRATSQTPFHRLPLVVLINGGSASAAEIMAACLQDHRRATIVGERSFGKGSVQEVIDLQGGRSALKLTVARYYSPLGRNIHRTADSRDADAWGVVPDPGYDLPLTADQWNQMRLERQRRDVLRHTSGSQPAPPPPDAPLEAPPPRYIDPQLRLAIEALHKLLRN
jgi:carboxyl-terminal processing protease